MLSVTYPSTGCNDGSLTLPVIEYDHTLGNCSISGGYRYRGALYSGLTGIYFYADFCSGRIWGASQNASGNWATEELLDTGLLVTAFGEDEEGELYLAHFSSSDGTIYKVIEPPPPGGGPWSGAVDLGSGWKWLDWFGYFNTNFDPWIYHQEHGWLYPFGTDTSSIWFWDNVMQAWWWTSDTVYSYVYRGADSAWLWYQEGSVSPRWFYNFTTGAWESF